MSRAEDLFEEMKNNPKGTYTAKDFETLYTGFGFNKRHGGNHTIYTHKIYQDIWATVKRDKPNSPGYARDAVDRVNKVKARQTLENALPKQEGSTNEQTQTAPKRRSSKRNKRTTYK